MYSYFIYFRLLYKTSFVTCGFSCKFSEIHAMSNTVVAAYQQTSGVWKGAVPFSPTMYVHVCVCVWAYSPKFLTDRPAVLVVKESLMLLVSLPTPLLATFASAQCNLHSRNHLGCKKVAYSTYATFAKNTTVLQPYERENHPCLYHQHCLVCCSHVRARQHEQIFPIFSGDAESSLMLQRQLLELRFSSVQSSVKKPTSGVSAV